MSDKKNLLIGCLALLFYFSTLTFVQADEVDELISQLKGDYSTRKEAAKALGEKRDSRAAEPLVALLGDQESHIQEAAEGALIKIGQPAVEPLINALKHQNWEVRKHAARALGKIKDARAVEQLIIALADYDYLCSWYIRQNAAEALGEIGDIRAVEPLIIALKDKEGQVRLAAVKALGVIKSPKAVEPLITALKDSDNRVREAASDALCKIGQPAVEPLIVVLKDNHEHIRKIAALSLDALGWKAKDTSEEAFYLIAKQDWDGCANIGEPAVPALIMALQSDDFHSQAQAARALGKIKDARAVEPLIIMLRKGRDARKDAVEALGKIGDPRAVESLIAALKDRDGYVREKAVRALNKIGDIRAIEPLVILLKDKDSTLRYIAAEALNALIQKVREPTDKAALLVIQDEVSEILKEKTKVCIGKFEDIGKTKVFLSRVNAYKVRNYLDKEAVNELFLYALNENLTSKGYAVDIIENETDNCEIKIDGTIETDSKTWMPLRAHYLINPLGTMAAGIGCECDTRDYVKLTVAVSYKIGNSPIKKTYSRAKKYGYKSCGYWYGRDTNGDLAIAISEEISSKIIADLNKMLKKTNK